MKAKNKKKMNPTVRSHLVFCGVAILLTVALLVWAKFSANTFFPYYTELSRKLMTYLAMLTSIFPFSVWECGAVGLAIWFFVSLGLDIHRKKIGQWFSGVLLGIVLLVSVFTCFWGLNHLGPKITEKMEISVENTTVSQLREATEYYAERAQELAAQVPRDANGRFDPGELSSQSDLAADSFAELAAENPNFSGSTASAKPLLLSGLYAKIGIAGIFIAYTGESCVSTQTYACSQPFTICHEMAHRACFAGENEANFVAFLACERSKSMILQYSGYYQAFVYCFNSLYEANRQQAEELWEQLTPELKADCEFAHTHQEKVQSEAASKIADAVNDTYLKAFSETSGTQSYGEVTDLLVAWYRKQ